MKTAIEMAREAGFSREHINTWMCSSEDIRRFAALVRADEREACAKEGWMASSSSCEDRVAAAIRARGNT
jgi:hypothetical protein